MSLVGKEAGDPERRGQAVQDAGQFQCDVAAVEARFDLGLGRRLDQAFCVEVDPRLACREDELCVGGQPDGVGEACGYAIVA